MASEGALQDRFKLFALLIFGEQPGLGVGDEESIQNNAVGPGEDLGVKNVQPRSSQTAGDLGEQPGPVPGAYAHGGIASVRLIMPMNNRRQGGILLVQLQMHETMRPADILCDLPG